jgi:hypothetical protein
MRSHRSQHRASKRGGPLRLKQDVGPVPTELNVAQRRKHGRENPSPDRYDELEIHIGASRIGAKGRTKSEKVEFRLTGREKHAVRPSSSIIIQTLPSRSSRADGNVCLLPEGMKCSFGESLGGSNVLRSVTSHGVTPLYLFY